MSKREPRQASNDRQSQQEEQDEEITVERSARPANVQKKGANFLEPMLLRRARVWDDLDWKYIELGQCWKAGEVTSPIELNLLTEREYMKQLSKAAASNRNKDTASDESDEDNEDSQDAEEEDEQSGPAAMTSDEQSEDQVAARRPSSARKRGRPRSSSQAGRSSMDQGSIGSGDDRKVGKDGSSISRNENTGMGTQQQER
eukprot:gene12826-12954_t